MIHVYVPDNIEREFLSLPVCDTLRYITIVIFHFEKTVRNKWGTVRKMCPYSKLFWSAFSRILTEYGEIRSISPYSVRIRGNVAQNNSEYGHFSLSEIQSL